ncbi:MAG: 50S ribosomal protein L19 [Asgard group archaeon]|nr:50S ribosomal protein L19 [Asgard group archaeon]
MPTVYEPLPTKRNGQPVLEYVQQKLLAKHDPTGKRRALVKNDSTGLRAGDIIKVTYLDRSDVTGRVIGIKRGDLNLGTNILIRTTMNRVGSEVRIPVYNPNIRNIECLYKPEKYLPRGKQFYIREHKRLDVGDVEAFIKKQFGDSKKNKKKGSK